MPGKKETTTPIPPAATGGEQSLMHKCSLSITEEKAKSKFSSGEKYRAGKDASVTLASIGVVTPQFQICDIWQGRCPLYPAMMGGGACA